MRWKKWDESVAGDGARFAYARGSVKCRWIRTVVGMVCIVLGKEKRAFG